MHTCYTHKSCNDGTAAAWIVKRVHPECKIIPISYRDPFPDISSISGNIIFVDITPKEPILKELINNDNVTSILIIDHHPVDYDLEDIDRITFTHDLTSSGCELTWKYYYPDTPVPWFLQIIGERDRFTFTTKDNEFINNGMYEAGVFTPKGLNDLLSGNEDELKDRYKMIGEMATRKRENIVKSEIKKCMKGTLEDINVLIIDPSSAAYLFTDISKEAIEEYKIDVVISVTYNIKEKWWHISMRSKETNVCEIARRLASKNDGGGHKNAASFNYIGDIHQIIN